MAVQLTLNQTVKLIREIATSHNQINTIYFGDIWEFLAQPDNVYPAMFYSLTGSQISGKNLAMDFSLFFLDRQLQDESNETDVLSDQLLIGQDIYSMMRYPKFDWKLEDSVSIDFFTENDKDYLAGVKLDITINYPMLTDRCVVPSSFSYPDYVASIGVGGSTNYVKFLLDYPNYASLPTIGDPGKIYVTNDTNLIYRWVDTAYVALKTNATVNWGSIAGTLSAQTDLQNALNAKYSASNPSGYISGITSGNVTTALGYIPENSSNKGIANGYASLDGSGLVPSTQLPSYVDDVLEYTNLASFPATGTTGKIYVDLATNKIYRWSGSIYVEVSPTVGTTWGGIGGTLSNQTDLQTALNGKQATLTAGTGISITSNTIASTITQYVDSNARSAISLTTTGTSGAATYNSSTGVLNIPQYTGGSGGSGTVTSVGLSAPTGFSVTGSPITASGTLALAFATGYSLPSDATQATWTAKQSALSGTGFVKISGTTISYDNSTYLTGITSGQVTTALGFTPYNATNPSNYIALTGLSSTATGLTYTNTTGVFSLTTGYAIPTTTSATNWDTAYTNRITSLTTTGSSGSATLSANTLNVPTYTLAGLGGQASSTNLTSLSGLTYASASFVKMTASGTFSLDTATYLTANQSITLSGAVTGSGTTAITTSLASSVVGISNLSATGTPSSTTYLRGDNTWATVSGGSFNGTLAAGTATTAPLDYTLASAVLKTTPLAGDFECDSNGISYYSHADSSRGVMHAEQFISLSTGAYTLTSQTGAQKLFNTTTNGALTVAGSTTYYFECFFSLSSMSGSTGAFGFAIGGTATLTSIGWTSQAVKTNTLTTAATLQTTYNTTASNTAIVSTSTSTNGTAKISGMIRINAGGTIIPQVSLGLAAAAIVGINSYFKIIPLGTSTINSVGNWS